MLSVMENRMDCGIWIEAFDAKYFGKGKPFGREEGHAARTLSGESITYTPIKRRTTRDTKST
jgi:hypothetical protein